MNSPTDPNPEADYALDERRRTAIDNCLQSRNHTDYRALDIVREAIAKAEGKS